MARTGMSDVITRFRRMVEAGTADYSVAGTTYWVDDQLQSALDRHLVRFNHHPLMAEPEWSSGSMVYKRFRYEDYEAERVTDGTAGFRVTDSNGSAIGTANYTVNYDQRLIEFTTDQSAELRYITANAFDMAAAAAEVWGDKASHYAASFDFATDNHDLKRSQLIRHAEMKAASFKQQRKARTIWIRRLDLR